MRESSSARCCELCECERTGSGGVEEELGQQGSDRRTGRGIPQVKWWCSSWMDQNFSTMREYKVAILKNSLELP